MKKILSLILCLATVLGCVSAALASGNTSIVKYESKSTYTVQVPEYIVPDGVGQQDTTEYSVTATNVVLPAGETLSVFVEYSGLVKEENDVSIPYKLYSGNGEINSGAQILTVAAGNPDETLSTQFGAAVTEDAKYSGVYLDTAIFSIKAPKTYTLEEIEANDHMIAVGETKPEYVVAEYNDDYTTVTLFKNGADSDGRMKSFESDPTQNLLAGHEDTLTTVNVSDGVVNIGACAFMNMGAMMQGSQVSSSLPYSTPGSTQKIMWYFNTEKVNSAQITTLNVSGDTLCSVDGWAFALCTNLRTLNLNNSLQTIGESAFMATDLSNFSKLPDGVQTIGEGAFAFTNMPAVEFGSNLEEIGVSAFGQNFRMKGDLIFPSTLKTIGSSAFADCAGLDGELVLNEGLTVIGSHAFDGCVNMTNTIVIIPKTVLEMNEENSSTAISKRTSDAFLNFASAHKVQFKLSGESAEYEERDGMLYHKESGVAAIEAPTEYDEYFVKDGIMVGVQNDVQKALYIDSEKTGTVDLSEMSLKSFCDASLVASNANTVIMNVEKDRWSSSWLNELANAITLYDMRQDTTVVLTGDALVKEGDVYKLA